MSSSRWRKSPSHGKCSRKYCGSSLNYGHSHHQRQRETFDGHAFKSTTGGVRPNARENGQISPSTTVRAARRASSRPHLAAVLREGRKTRILTPVWESSGESRFKGVIDLATSNCSR